MKKILLFTAALLCTASMWAENNYYPTEEPLTPAEGGWIYSDVNNMYSTDGNKRSASFNSLDHSAWNKHDDESSKYIIYQLQSFHDGLGFAMHCKTIPYSKCGVFSLYRREEHVPAYTRMELTWWYRLLGYSEEFTQCVVLYAHDNMIELKDAQVDWSAYYNGKTDSPYFMDSLMTINSTSGEKSSVSERKSRQFDFDNRYDSTMHVKSWYLMLTLIVEDWADRTWNTKNWGTFLDCGYDMKIYYYKYVTFDANGGEGTMSNDTIENAKNLTANAFTRNGYTFAGWAMAPNDTIVYADGAEITATGDSKGPVTLYAQWTKDSGSGMDNTPAGKKATKRIVDGQLIIEKNGKKFDITGAELE